MAGGDAEAWDSSRRAPSAAEVMFGGSSPVAELCRGLDWGQTALGPVERWPSALRHAVAVLLAQPLASNVVWGSELNLIYNAAFQAALGDEHPQALGKPVAMVFPDPSPWRAHIARALSGQAVYMEDAPFEIVRSGRTDRLRFTSSCVPLRDDSGAIAGVLTTAIETTRCRRAERALERREAHAACLAEASEALARAATASAALHAIGARLGERLAVSHWQLLEVAGEARLVRVLHEWHADPLAALGGWPRALDLALAGRLLHARHEGSVVQVDDTATARDAADADEAERLGVRAFMAAPIVVAGRPRGVSCVYARAPRAWQPGDAELLRVLSERLWLGIESARAESRVTESAESSARQQAEEALRESRERLRLALDAATMGTFIWYPSEDRVDPDVHMLALFGQPETGELSLESALTSLLHPDDRARAGAAVARALAPSGDGRLREDVRVVLPQGGERWVSVRGQVCFDGGPLRMAGVALDITDRKRAETALRESEERLRLAVSATRLGIYDWDLTNDRVTVNARFREMFGLSDRKAIDAAVLSELVHPDDRAFVSSQIMLALDPSATGSYEFEHRALTPRGVRWLLRFGQVQFSGEGARRRAVRIIGNDRDITTRKRAEQALRASEERQVFLLELSDALRPFVDPIAVQSEACRLLCEKLEGARCHYAEFDEAAGYISVARDYVRGGAPSLVGRYPLAAFDWASPVFRRGKAFAVNDTQDSPLIPSDRRAALDALEIGAFVAAPLVKGGRLLAVLTVLDLVPRAWTQQEVGLVQEVAERTWAAVERARAEAALAAELSATKILQQISTDLIPKPGQAVYTKLVDAATQLMQADAACLQLLEPDGGRLRLLAWKNLDPQSTQHWQLVEAGSSGACGQAIARKQRVLARDVEQSELFAGTQELEELRRSGLRAVLSAPLVARSGQLVGILSAYWRHVHEPSERDFDLFDVLARQVADLLERERAEAEAAAARAQAEAANRAKDAFLATLSHELRTPLAAILLWAGALRSGAVPHQDLPRAIDAIVKSAESQSRLIEDLLDLSRLASGKLALSRATVEVGTIARAALDMVKPLAATKQIALRAELDGACVAVLDGARLEQVLWNLLTNATKFTPHGGAVTLTVRSSPEHVELEVSDTGEGIAPEFLPQLFEKFRQYDMGDTRQHMGLGIGLALAKQLVELHGGTITAESAGLGCGAVFRVRLPRLEADGEAGDPSEAAPVGGASRARPLRRLRVLLVEDDMITRQAMRWTLTHAGASVVDVATADEALAALGAGDGADVIVSDLGLPGVSGLTLIERIVRDSRQGGRRTPPSCAVSAHARDVDRRRAIDAGFDMYITKPVSPERLIEAVSDLREILASGRE